ncbi:hypothetical protein LPJ56_004969, partial [Coemansia sp. RSA 2599]
MDLAGQSVDAKLEARIDSILKSASATTAQLSTPAVCKRLAQFGASSSTLQRFESACRMFGRFDSDALQSVYNAVRDHQKAASVFGTAEASERLHAEDGGGGAGGLVYVPKSRRAADDSSATKGSSSLAGKSLLGLDRRAAELRQRALQSMNRKRELLDDDDKNGQADGPVVPVKFRQTHGAANLRQRRADTPSNPGGLSETAQRRLDEHRRKLHGSEASRRGIAYDSGRSRRDDYGRSRRSRSRSRSKSRSPGRGRDGKRSDSRRQGSHYRDGRSSRWDTATPRRPDSPGGGSRDHRRPATSSSSSRSKSSWDVPTPRRPTDRSSFTRQRTVGGGHREGTGAPVEGDNDDDDDDTLADRREWEMAQKQIDREWYSLDETGGAVDDAHNPFADYVDHDDKLETKLIGQQAKRMNARQMQNSRDNDEWVNSRLVHSGLMQATGAEDVDDDADQNRVHLLVHDLKPPFLEGSVLTRQLDPVKTVVDPTSDLAVFARKGSALVREMREKRERMKATRDAVNMAGTTLGNVMGV